MSYRPLRSLLLLLAVATPASAAPVATHWTLEFRLPVVPPLTISGAGVVNVTGSTVQIPAGALAITQPFSQPIPLSGQSALQLWNVTQLSNLAGTFSLGGVSNQVSSEVCAATPPAGSACNAGGGLGGAMGLTGSLLFHIIPNIVVIPINLNAARVGQGGVGSLGFTAEAALWSTGAGLINTGNNATSLSGGTAPLRLVSPTFLVPLGNLFPLFATLTLTSVTVPEPGTLLLLGVGVVGAIAVLRAGRRR